MGKMIEVEREEKAVGTKWRWHVRGRPKICGLSAEPLLAACRALKSMGELPSREIALFRPGKTFFDLKTTVGYGSGKTVREDQRTSPRFVDYHPFNLGEP
jgi:hypothetical protein